MSEWETQTITIMCIFLMVISSFANMALCLRWNIAIGISDMTFVVFTGTTFLPMLMAFYIVPPFVLIAKITPAHVEATIFSFAASVINAGIHFLGKYTGLAWNKAFFGITTENLEENFWKLCLLEMCFALVCLVYIPLLPTWEEVRKQQAHLKELNEDSDV